MSEKRSFGDFVDRLTSVAAIITAVAAVAIAVYEARINRQEQKKSVWPYVMQYNSNTDQEYTRSVENVGLGPALVRSFEVRVDDSLYSGWRPVVHALTGADSVVYSYSYLGMGSVLRAGERFVVLRIPPGPAATAFFEHRSELSTKVCYCSLYGDCWLSDSERNEPSAVDSCGEGRAGG